MIAENRTVVLVEPMWTRGHYETQMYLFLSILLPKNCRLMVLCAEPEKVKEWAADILPNLQNKLFTAHYSLIDDHGWEKLKAGQAWPYLSETLHKAEAASGWNIDMVFINSLDIIIYGNWRGWLFWREFDYPWAGLYVTPAFRLKRNSRKGIKRFIQLQIFRRVRNGQAIAILDEGTKLQMQAFFKDRKVFVFPDVTDERLPSPLPEKFNQIKEKAGGRTIIGMVGLLQKRKGWLNFLRAIPAMNPEECFFLTAGYLHRPDYTREEQLEIDRLMASLEGANCHFELGYIDDPAEVNAYITLCDVVYLCYENFYYSSGIMTKASSLKKLMLVTKGYCMGERVEKYGLGLTVKEGDLDEIIAALTTLSEAETREEMMRKAQFDRFMLFHNVRVLDTALSEILGVDM
ncbi:MAG TPA: glycosyltransferase [Syntrophomonadaceae bacterium]|jgi:glycosyltransferase involved in cell wall biosynthesis|nr:glycosyltransferase [Syntrophomonadaceae bacterium]HRX21431.1 glycosyltransferase [Syntrophomonadaceae bacterium]